MTNRLLCLLAFLCTLQLGRAASDPWTADETVQPEALVKQLANPPAILMVGPRILYNGGHVKGAVYGGPAGKPEGLDNLVKAAATLRKERAIVIYCGCCPMDKCPNIRPAFQKLKELGYQNVKVLIIPANLHDDWIVKGYPVEKGNVPQ